MLLLATLSGSVLGRSITARQAERAVSAWLRTDALSVQTDYRRPTKRIEAFTDEAGEPIYYVVGIRPTGFVIVSADDEVEPIIGFSNKGDYDPSPTNPLFALAAGDLKGRIEAVRTGDRLRTERIRARAERAKKKWDRFAQLSETFDEGGESTESAGASSIANAGAISDMRVAPLLASEWGQREVCSEPCFNYYTPENYRVSCVGITMAQVMRYYEYPTGDVGRGGFWIWIEGNSDWTAAYMRGGDGYGGPYNWDDMVLIPSCSTTLTQRKAIGALCYDAAISVNTVFGSQSSQADTLRAKKTLVEAFNFSSAVKGYNNENNIGEGLIEMINPNLDARHPVILGIKDPGGHAVVCDGYGYNSSTLYHHLNMGWRGVSDAWYNLPNIDSSPSYSSIHKCIYNIHALDLEGEHVSGRILSPSGVPIPWPSVYARSADGSHEVDAKSYDNGIYAFNNLRSAQTYTIYVSAAGYEFTPRSITTGTSQDNSAVSGNIWGVDFYGQAVDALIGRWKLDELDGNTVAEDSAGINDGTVHGGASWLSSGGMLDGAIQLDGDGYVRIPNESNFDLVDQITVAAWVKNDSREEDFQSVIAKGASAWQISSIGQKRRMRRFRFSISEVPAYVDVDGIISVGASEWHHVCGTYDGANLRLYVDGVLDPASPVSYTGGIAVNNFDVYIGANAEQSWQGWTGAIDEVRVYNYALNPGEVASLMCLAPVAGDVNHDCTVDMADYAVFTAAYNSTPGHPRWNPECDISQPADNVIDFLDMNTFLTNWLMGD